VLKVGSVRLFVRCTKFREVRYVRLQWRDPKVYHLGFQVKLREGNTYNVMRTALEFFILVHSNGVWNNKYLVWK
jgi:hypothetical protein